MWVCANYLISQILNFLIHKNELIPSSWVSVEVARSYECSTWHRNDRLFLSLLDLHTFPSPNQPFKLKVPQKRMRGCLLPQHRWFPSENSQCPTVITLKISSVIHSICPFRQAANTFFCGVYCGSGTKDKDRHDFIPWLNLPSSSENNHLNKQ